MTASQHTKPPLKIPATFMRGGTSKGVFFNLPDLPPAAQVPGKARDRLLLRVMGSPDPYGKQMDGMGGASSSTSKAVIVCKSEQPDHDVDYLFGQVAIDRDFVDWSGNCGNLTAAVGAFAVSQGLIDPGRIPQSGTVAVRIWQKNIGKTIIARVPVSQGQVQESGDFELDGVTFPAAEIALEFIAPVNAGDEIFPTGKRVDLLTIPGVGELPATIINAGIPTVFVNAADIGFTGTELQGDINQNPQALRLLEDIRIAGSLQASMISRREEAGQRQHTPKIAFVAPPQNYVASSGKTIEASMLDLLVRAVSMGQLHHAMMATTAVAIAASAAIPGTLVTLAAGGEPRQRVCFGHPSGSLHVGAVAQQRNGQWCIEKAMMSRSARVLMEGWVRIPQDF
jgi:probable AcnD-accessory protein PrpF